MEAAYVKFNHEILHLTAVKISMPSQEDLGEGAALSPWAMTPRAQQQPVPH